MLLRLIKQLWLYYYCLPETQCSRQNKGLTISVYLHGYGIARLLVSNLHHNILAIDYRGILNLCYHIAGLYAGTLCRTTFVYALYNHASNMVYAKK